VKKIAAGGNEFCRKWSRT